MVARLSTGLIGCGVAVVLTGSGLAQSVAMTLSAPVAGSITPMGAFGLPIAFPAGPLPFGVVMQHATGPGVIYVSASLTVDPFLAGQVAPSAFRIAVETDCYAETVWCPWGQPINFSAIQLDATVRLTITPSAPTSGRLVLRYWAHGIGSSSTSIGMDIGADGSVDTSVVADVNPVTIELPLSLSSATDIDFVVDTSDFVFVTAPFGGWAFDTSFTEAVIEAQWFEGQAAVEGFDTTGATAVLEFDHALNDTLSLAIEDGFGQPMPGLTAIGLQPVTIPLSATLMQLVSLDVVVLSSSFSVPMPLLPAGLAVYMQGFGIDTSGAMHGTQSLRAQW
ncbi:MAG: hypothetical protein ACI89X_001317 [Planctomycetota bacterium]|jgi:hypothetical protein